MAPSVAGLTAALSVLGVALLAPRVDCHRADRAVGWCPLPDSNRHGSFEPQDFKSCVSTNSTKRAMVQGMRPSAPDARVRPGHDDFNFLLRRRLPFDRLGV